MKFKRGAYRRFTLSLLLLTLLLRALTLLRTEPASSMDNERLIKLSAQGETLPPWQGPWACIHDTLTGLLWENKTNNESIHDGYWSYSWFNEGKGQANSGDCYFEAQRCDTQDLIRRTNEEKLCGTTGWRLPTKAELSSLLEQQDRPQAPQLRTDFFQQIKAGDYWSAQGAMPLEGHYQHLGQGASAINFYQGRFHNLPYRNAAFAILVTDKWPKSQYTAGVTSRTVSKPK
ncbi:Lcl C-terminal domain-containing protein [Shewanella woodyi]|uniref:Lcl C-terminal domain-containing protein n=1 Tax=Shewanella woodyi TaxID=60961 RepID=UPI0007F96315|nr:DUF1566 domain-containing protein [Shewanella woodyi]